MCLSAPWCAWCRGSVRTLSPAAVLPGTPLNTRWDGCQEQPWGEPADQMPGGQRRDKPPSVRGGELPHRLYGVGQRGCAAAGWHPASGLGCRRRRRPRPAAARLVAWRHVVSRAPQRRCASRAGQLAGRQHVHRPTEGEANQHGLVNDPAADHAGAGSVGSPRARRVVAGSSAGGRPP